MAAALGSAVYAACRGVIQAFLDTVADDPHSPLRGCRLEEVMAEDGRIQLSYDAARGEAFSDVLARHGLAELTADGSSAPPAPQDVGMAPAGAFAARFAEVRVDSDLGLVRVARIVSAVDAGRILNEKTATSQIIGGAIGGIGMALLEETVTDPGTGRIANANLGDYLVPVTPTSRDRRCSSSANPTGSTRSGSRGSAKWAWSALPRPSPTRSFTPPAGASARCRSPSTSFSDVVHARWRSARRATPLSTGLSNAAALLRLVVRAISLADDARLAVPCTVTGIGV